MELGVDIFRVKGRATKPVSGTIVRALERADMEVLQGSEGRHTQSPLKRLGERHHSLARNLASGMKAGEAAIICGYGHNRVNILLNDPSFKELVEFYRRDFDAQYRDLHQRLSGIALDAAEELSERLEDKPEEISTGQLMELVKLGADRTGYGPSSSSTQVNIHVNMADRLKAARERVAQRARMIEGEILDGS